VGTYKLYKRKFRSTLVTSTLLISIFIIPLLSLIQPTGSSPPWWNTFWNFRKPITLNHTKINGNLQNFPILIDLFDNDLRDKAQSDGDDIIFINSNNNKLNHEIEIFDSNSGHLVTWVKIPMLNSSADTTLYMYYGNPEAIKQQNPAAVWDSNFIMVQHLEETSTIRYDSTVYGNNGTTHNVHKSINGKIDGADEFDGLSDYVTVADDTSLNPSSAITIELWMNISSTGDFVNLVNKGRYSQYYLRLGPQEGRTYWYVKFDDGTVKSLEGNIGWTWNKWHYIVATLDTKTRMINVSLDGIEKINGTFDPGKNTTKTTNSVLISDINQRWIKGTIDEVRISNTARSADWIKTSYNNQKDPKEFYKIENEETYSYEPLIFENPQNEATDVYTNPTLSAKVLNLNEENMTIIFRERVSNSWINLKIYENVPSGTYITVPTSMKNLGTTYHWRVCINNGEIWTNKTFSLTTTTKILKQKWVAQNVPKGVSGVLIADVNNDSVEEIIHAGKGGIAVLNGTNGSTIWNISDNSIGDHAQARITDLTQDGIPEIIVPLETPAGILVLHANNGSEYWRITNLGKETYSSPVVFDIDGTGYPTIFVASTDIYNGLNSSGRVTSLSHNGTILHQTFSWRPCSGGLSIADTDMDGEFELYMGDRYMYLNDPEYGDNDYGKGVQSFWAENLTLRWSRPEVFCSSNIPMLADVNGDGILDVIVGDLNGGLAVFNSTDGSTIRKTQGIPNQAPVHYQPCVYDIDGDGNLELLMADPHDETSDDLVVWDLVKWKVDARIYVGKNFYGPQVADVTGDSVMEIIACNYRSVLIIDRTYRVIDGVLGISGEVSYGDEVRNIDGISMLAGTLNYPVVQDIDDDGYNELVVSTQSGTIYAFDTPARRPNARPRSEVQFYSEFRLGAAEYVQPQGGPAPVISSIQPSNFETNIPISLSKLSFSLTDYQRDSMNYTVTTSPFLGNDTKTNVSNGRFTLSISSMAPSTTYTWVVNVTDGKHWTYKTFTFTTEDILPWWNSDWEHRRKIVIDQTKISADLLNFPVLIDITDGDLADKAQKNGSDIVFIETNNNKLNHEIELYDNSTGHLIAWVNVLLLSSTTDTTLYMYYGNPEAIEQQNPSAVWDSNFVMVQHLEEDEQNRFDSTAKGNDGTIHGDVEKSEGKIDSADEFDGVDDYMEIADDPSLNPTLAITIELWMNLSSTGDYINLVNKGLYSQYCLRSGSQEGRTYWCSRFDDGTAKSVEGSIGWTWDTWHHLMVTLDAEANMMKVYLDGVEKLSSTFSSGKSIAVTTSPVLISDISRRWIKGIIDEVRISNVARSADWIKASYNNQKDPEAFYAIEEEESIPDAPMVSNPSPPNKASSIPLSLSELGFNITDCQGDLMNYTVTTHPDIGSGNDTNVTSGRFTLSLTGTLEYSTTYMWTVNATDGNETTTITFSFTTLPSSPPYYEDNPILQITGAGDMICYNQTTYDPDGDKVTNIYNWYRNNAPIANLLLSFDTNSSTTTKDYSGYDNNGEIVRGVTWTSNGRVGGAYKFERGFIQIPGTNTLDGGGAWSEITVEHWIYLTASQSGTRIIAKIPSYEIGISGNKVFAGVWIDPGNPMLSGYNRVTYETSLDTNTWYHVALTYKSGENLTLYVNGIAIATTQVSGNIQTSGSNPLHIGWFDYFQGIIDEIRIYQESLSPQQIYQRYFKTKDGLTNSSTIVSQETEIGEVWKCEVTPNDADQDGTPKFSNSITIGFKDDFNDNSTNSQIWKTLEKNNGNVSETNNRLECTVPSGAGTAGYITKESYDLSDSYIQIDVSNQYLCEAALAITLDGINDHFWYSDNFYVIEKHRWSEDVDGLTCKVKKRIDSGDRIYLYEGTWTGPAGSLAIRIEDGIIEFYEDGNLRYSEPFELASYECHIHFEANTWHTSRNGTDYFDNFIFQNNEPAAYALAITPTMPTTNDDLVADYTYFDPDGDPEDGTEIRWYRDGVLQPEFNDILEIPSSATAIGETWHFTARPKDGTDFGELQVSPTVAVVL